MERIVQPTTGDHDGGIAMWTTGDCSRSHVQGVMDQFNRGHCVPGIDYLLSLKAAGDEVVNQSNLRITGQPILTQNLDRKSVGCEWVRKVPGEKRNSYVSLFSAGVIEVSKDTYVAKILDVNATSCPLLAQNIVMLDLLLNGMFQKHTNLLQTTQLTTAMRRLVLQDYRGTKLKDGVYFLPAPCVPEYESICSGIEAHPTSARFTLFEYKLVPSSSGLRAIMDGINEEITAGIKELMGELSEMQQNATKMRRDGLETRIARVQSFYDKVSYYEQMLGQAMPDLHQAISAAQSSIGVHQMLSMSAS